MNVPTLTVVIPAYNEARTIVRLLDAVVAAAFEKQIVVVDDGSTDTTADALEQWRLSTGREIEVIRHATNRGKGAAIRTGLASARGEVTIVQDADLEYDPSEYPQLVAPILAGRADAVYGSRYLQPCGHPPWTLNRACVVLLNFMVRLLYGRRLTDEATCYKVLRTDLLRRMDLKCERFEFCPEVTAKLCRMGIEIREVPISYAPRTSAEGKKIRWSDGVEAIVTLLRWRFATFRPCKEASPEPHAPASPEQLVDRDPVVATEVKALVCVGSEDGRLDRQEVFP